jgi:hypothetical protein
MARMVELEELQAELAKIHALAGNTCVLIEGMTWGAVALNRERGLGALKDQPLHCAVEENRLVISIGVDTLAFADKQRIGHKINNPLGFAEDVARMLQDEDEVGATLLTELLDSGMQAAVDDGTEFVDYEEYDADMEREY